MTSPQISRRSVAAGVAWALPAVTVATALPAQAASFDCTPTGCPTLTFDAAASPQPWTTSVLGSITPNSGQTGIVSSWAPATGTNACLCNDNNNSCAGGGPGGGGPYPNVAIAEQDPAASGAGLVLAQNVCLVKGGYFGFSYDWATYAANPIGTTFQVYLLPAQAEPPSYTSVAGLLAQYDPATGAKLGQPVLARSNQARGRGRQPPLLQPVR